MGDGELVPSLDVLHPGELDGQMYVLLYYLFFGDSL
jgi:hypothetical protein